MKLRIRIQRSMLLVIFATLAIAYALTTYVVYRQTQHLLQNEISQEADYIKEAIEISGTAYLNDMDSVRENTRVTWISEKGNVLYDSRQDDVTLQNHSNRLEFREAIQSGVGADSRRSDTLDKEMYYYAVRLSDGSVLRVSKSVDTIFHTALKILPGMGLIGLLMLLFAVLLSKRQIDGVIRPINELNINNPLENETYEELTPLLERIDEQNKQKDAIANMRKEFTANVSHELKTPLTSISGYAEIMKNGLVKPEDMKGFSERIYNEASRLISLVEDIIKLSKLDEGKVELEKEEVDLYEMTREICSRLSLQSAEKNVRVEVTGENVSYLGIRQILDEMLYNMIENAIKYNKDGGSVSIWVGKTLKGTKVVITDTGIGIPEGELDRIFERFYRVDKSHSRKIGGTGLGLSIVKHGAMLHGAEIHVKSEVGKGTKMELTF